MSLSKKSEAVSSPQEESLLRSGFSGSFMIIDGEIEREREKRESRARVCFRLEERPKERERERVKL